MIENDFRAGFIAIAGRPNVGKSTLLNALVGRKISIVTSKPQTTRRRVLGIKTTPRSQMIFVDTPGLHAGERRAINRSMNRAALAAAGEADLCLQVVEALRWEDEDDLALQRLKDLGRPLGLAVSKVDVCKPRTRLIPFLEEIKNRHDYRFIVPVSAQSGENLAELENALLEYLPRSPMLFPADQVSDQEQAVQASEFVREQLIVSLREELPYSVAVQVDEFTPEGNLLRIAATIWVEREGQKAIVIGEGGSQLKSIGRAARLTMEKEFGKKVFLKLWVKVRENWTDDQRALAALGIEQA